VIFTGLRRKVTLARLLGGRLIAGLENVRLREWFLRHERTVDGRLGQLTGKGSTSGGGLVGVSGCRRVADPRVTCAENGVSAF